MNKSYILLITIFLLCSCSHKRQQSLNVQEQDTAWVDVFHLLGKHVYSLDSILQNEDKQANIIFLFNFYDCGSCIDSGFQLVKRIDKFYRRKSVPIISSMGNPTQFQIRNKYQEYIYSDNNDLIRKELKYMPTPILIQTNDEKKIINYIFPNVSDEQEYKRFFRFMNKTDSDI